MLIRNTAALLSHGNIAGRKAVLDILETGLAAGDPYQNVKDLIRIEGHKLIIGNDKIKPDLSAGMTPSPDYPPLPERLEFDLREVKNIYLTGGGKAAQRQAQAIEEILGDRITEGHINAKKGDEVYLKYCTVTLAGHPLPDEDSVSGARRIYEIERKAKKGDLIFISESGGGSALMALPAPGITLDDLLEVNQLLYFGCGSSMPEANAVRNMISVVRGRHARHCGEATMIHIATPELPPNLKVHLTERPEGMDSYDYAIYVLRKYDLWEKVSQRVRDFLLRRDPEYSAQNAHDWFDNPRYYFRVMGPEFMLEAAKKRAEELGLGAHILVSSLSDIEAAPAADMAAYIAHEIEINNQPFQAPCVLLMGGECVVTVGQEKGWGGRNQEFVLSAAQRIADSKRVIIASCDSDGADGPTDKAGGIVDGYTWARAKELGINILDELKHHNACPPLVRLGDAIDTGILKTNLRDLRVVYIGPKE